MVVGGNLDEKSRLIPSACHAHKCQVNFSTHAASVYPALANTCWQNKQTNKQKKMNCTIDSQLLAVWVMQ